MFSPAPARPGLPSGSGAGRSPRVPGTGPPPHPTDDPGHSAIETLAALALLAVVGVQLIAAIEVSTTAAERVATTVTATALVRDVAARLVAAERADCSDPAVVIDAGATNTSRMASTGSMSVSVGSVGPAALDGDGVWRWRDASGDRDVTATTATSPTLCRIAVRAADGSVLASRSVVLTAAVAP